MEGEVEQFVVHEYNSEEYYLGTHKIMIGQAHGSVERLRLARAKRKERQRRIRQKTRERFRMAHEATLRRTEKKTPRNVQEIVEVSQGTEPVESTTTSTNGLYTIQNMDVLKDGLEAIVVPPLDTDIDDLEGVTGITVQLRTITEPDDPLLHTYDTIVNPDEITFNEFGEIISGNIETGSTAMIVDPISVAPFRLGDTIVTIKSVHREDGEVALNGEHLRVESLVWLFPDLRAEDFQPVSGSNTE